MKALRNLLGVSLGRRFSLSAGALALFLALVFAAASYRMAFGDAKRDATATLNGLIDAVRNTAAVGGYAADLVLLDEVANGLVRHPMVGSVRIELSQGPKVLRQRSNTPAPPGTPTAEAVLHSPFDPKEIVGRLSVGADPVALTEAAGQQALRVALPMFVQVLLLSVLLNALAGRLLARPMSRLAEQVGRLQPGTDERLSVSRRHEHDEIGRLVRRTNELLQANAAAFERERELRDAVSSIELRLRRLLDASSAAIFLLDSDGRLVQGNPTLVRVCTGRTDGELPLHSPVARFFAKPEALEALLRNAQQQGQSLSADLRLARTDADGAEHWVHVLLSPLVGDDGAPLVEGVLYDVTQRRREEQAAQHLALHDTLTGLRNRAGLMVELDGLVAAAQATGASLSLLYLDLDGFKAVNDQRGHEAGDVVLREVAQRLRGLLRRGGDLCARLGGDEFVLLLQAAADEPWVPDLAWRITRLLAEPIPLAPGEPPARIGASVGIAGLPRDAYDRDGLLRQADQAMYEVKRAGKNGVATPQGPLPKPDTWS